MVALLFFLQDSSGLGQVVLYLLGLGAGFRQEEVPAPPIPVLTGTQPALPWIAKLLPGRCFLPTPSGPQNTMFPCPDFVTFLGGWGAPKCL